MVKTMQPRNDTGPLPPFFRDGSVKAGVIVFTTDWANEECHSRVEPITWDGTTWALKQKGFPGVQFSESVIKLLVDTIHHFSTKMLYMNDKRNTRGLKWGLQMMDATLSISIDHITWELVKGFPEDDGLTERHKSLLTILRKEIEAAGEPKDIVFATHRAMITPIGERFSFPEEFLMDRVELFFQVRESQEEVKGYGNGAR